MTQEKLMKKIETAMAKAKMQCEMVEKLEDIVHFLDDVDENLPEVRRSLREIYNMLNNEMYEMVEQLGELRYKLNQRRDV